MSYWVDALERERSFRKGISDALEECRKVAAKARENPVGPSMRRDNSDVFLGADNEAAACFKTNGLTLPF